MNKVFLLMAATIAAHIHSIMLLQRNLETGDILKIIWGIVELVLGIVLLQQAYRLFKKTYNYHQ